MSNDVADCPYCDEGLISEGYEVCHCDRCGRRVKYDEILGFGARIDNNRYRKRIGLKELGVTEYINQHIIRINYQPGIDVKSTENMIEYIKLVIRKETGTEPEIEEYLL